MESLIVNGGRELRGTIKVQGSKNTVLPIIAAALLCENTVEIHNIPHISDVEEMLEILKDMGAEIRSEEHSVSIYTKNTDGVLNFSRCKKLRASSLFMGALLGKNGYFVIPYPGGCDIGKRPIDFHLEGFMMMGATIEQKSDMIIGYCNHLKGINYDFKYPSVGALENFILAAVCAYGTSRFTHCAREPEIYDLCRFLNKAGAKITGMGTDEIVVEGVKKLDGVSCYIPGDRIVAGTYMMACAVTGGNIRLKGICPDRVMSTTHILKKAGCHIFTDTAKNEIIILSDGRKKAVSYVETGPFPMFATDMQPQMIALSAYLDGITVISDKVFENRYHIIDELKKMGADISVHGREVVVKGKESLMGSTLKAHDLRQGAALVTAALGARNISTISNCAYINRGYENIAEDMEQLGADIKWQEEDKKEL